MQSYNRLYSFTKATVWSIYISNDYRIQHFILHTDRRWSWVNKKGLINWWAEHHKTTSGNVHRSF